MGRESGKTIAEMKYTNEVAHLGETAVEDGLSGIIAAMNDCIDRGLAQRGTLPGGLDVKRRAADLF